MSSTRNDFYESLPKKRMAAGMLILDDEKRILIVKPTYKDSWEIPGGIVELDESPAACAVREVKEELGLTIPKETLRLLCLDYMHKGNEKTEALMFIFFGGTMGSTDLKRISLPVEELSTFEFCHVEDASQRLNTVLADRVGRAFSALQNNNTVYFDGFY